jgi:hypothetical protein
LLTLSPRKIVAAVETENSKNTLSRLAEAATTTWTTGRWRAARAISSKAINF